MASPSDSGSSSGAASRAGGLARGRVLVTGGAGFLGSALVWALNRRGIDSILVADYLGQDEKWRNLTPLSFADYLEADELLRLLRERSSRLDEVATVLHLGACSATTERDVRYLVQNNFEYTKELASWALERGARFVYASSAATYGDGSAGMDDSGPLAPLRPLNAYGWSKHLFDRWAEGRGLLGRMVGLKYFNVFGPNEDHKGEMRSLVHKAYGQVLERGAIRLFKSHREGWADGEQERDFLYVKDAVAITLHLAESGSAAGLYNVGSGRASTWNELARAVFAALGTPERIEYIDMPESLRAKYQYTTRAELARLRASGWSAEATPLADAVRDYVRAYLQHDRRLGDGEGEPAAERPPAALTGSAERAEVGAAGPRRTR